MGHQKPTTLRFEVNSALRPLLVQASLEAIDTTARARRLLLARVGGVAGAASFHRLRLYRARNLINGTAVGAVRFRVGVHGGVDSGLHKPGDSTEK